MPSDWPCHSPDLPTGSGELACRTPATPKAGRHTSHIRPCSQHSQGPWAVGNAYIRTALVPPHCGRARDLPPSRVAAVRARPLATGPVARLTVATKAYSLVATPRPAVSQQATATQARSARAQYATACRRSPASQPSRSSSRSEVLPVSDPSPDAATGRSRAPNDRHAPRQRPLGVGGSWVPVAAGCRWLLGASGRWVPERRRSGPRSRMRRLSRSSPRPLHR